MAKFNFFQIFQQNPDGSLSPTRVININGVTFGPGVAFNKGVLFGGVNLYDFFGLDVAAEEDNGILIIKGFFQNK
jgi:hypothetical protein